MSAQNPGMKLGEMKAAWRATNGEGMKLLIIQPFKGLTNGWGIHLKAQGQPPIRLQNDKRQPREFQSLEALTNAMESITGTQVLITVKAEIIEGKK